MCFERRQKEKLLKKLMVRREYTKENRRTRMNIGKLYQQSSNEIKGVNSGKTIRIEKAILKELETITVGHTVTLGNYHSKINVRPESAEVVKR